MIISVVAQKGGVGKSTLAINVAAALSDHGRRVLLVDADPQGTARTWGYVAGQAGNKVPAIISMGPTMHRPGQLSQIAEPYEYVLIDTPAKHGEIQRSSLLIAHAAVLPCGPSPADAWALAASLELISEARTIRSDLKACIVISRKRARTVLGKSSRQVLLASGLPILKAELEDRICYQEALAAGQGVTAYAPGDSAAREVRALVTELLTFAQGVEEYGQEANRNDHEATSL